MTQPNRSRVSLNAMPFSLDTLECRRLMSVNWSDYAKLIGQADASTTYSTLTGKGETVAMIDTGIDYTNASLGGGFGKGYKVVGGYDFYSNDNDPMDTDGHGTETAGMVAANRFTYNGTTYQGIAPDAHLVALRVGTGDDITDDNIEKALQWVIKNYKTYGISVVNISLGSDGDSSYVTDSQFGDEFASLKKLGIVVVAASGNSGDESKYVDTVSSPASDPDVFAAGSITSTGAISDFTQRASILGLLAPGEGVVSTKMGGGYESVDGTSFSSPLTAGVFALLQQATSNLSVDDLESVVRSSSTTNVDGTGTGLTTGRAYAQLDLVDAITLAKSRDDASLDYIAASKSTTVDSVYDQSGDLHLAYYDATTHKLMYAVQNTEGKWTTPIVVDKSGAQTGQYLSIAVDPTGKVGIAYYDGTNADLKYAWFSNDRWSNTTLDSKGSVGQYASLAYTADGDPAIAYYRKTTGDLRLETYDHTTGTWGRQTLDSTGDVGSYASIAYYRGDDANYSSLAVAYADSTNGNLKYYRYTDAPGLTSAEATITQVADDLSGVSNIDASLVVLSDTTSPQIAIAYQDAKNQDVKYAYKGGTDGTWSTVSIASAGSVGSSISTYVDSDKAYHVVYYNKTKKASYDATIDPTAKTVESTARIGTVGLVATIAQSVTGEAITLLGLNKAGKSIDDIDLLV